jgi:hypothetical protein
MARSGLLDGICGKKANRVDAFVFKGFLIGHF